MTAPPNARYHIEVVLGGKYQYVNLIDGQDRDACGGFPTAETCAAFIRDENDNPRPITSVFLDGEGIEVAPDSNIL